MNQSNKESAITFLNLVSSGRISEGYEKYISPNLRHHNAYFKGDAASLQAGMEENQLKFPHKTFEVQRVLEDGNLVAVHSRLRFAPEMQEMAVVHILRFENGMIMEMWDVGQQLPAETPNENGMF